MPGLLRRRRQLVLGGSGLDAASLVGDVYFPLAADALAVKGGYTPTVARTTTAAFTDYEGVVRMAAANELRFEGGRRISEGVWSNVKPDGSPIYPVPKLLMEGQCQNKVTAKTANPVDTTGVAKSGDAAAVLSVVDDAAALAAAGLNALCISGKVYKLDNSAGTTDAWVNFTSATGNTNTHTMSVYCRCPVWISGNNYVEISDGTSVDVVSNKFAYQPTYIKRYIVKTPSSTGAVGQVWAKPGNIIYFILPQLEELPVASSVIPNDTGSPLTRTADALSWPLSAELQAMLSIDKAWSVSLANQTGLTWGAEKNQSSFADGQSWFDHPDFNASVHANAGRMMILRDSAGRLAWGFIGAAGTGQTLGSERLLNGDMSSATGWNATNWTISEGVATHTAGNTSSLYQVSVPLVDKKAYKASLDLVSQSAGIAIIRFGAATIRTLTAGTNICYGCGVSDNICRIPHPSIDSTAVVDNASLKEILTPSSNGVYIYKDKERTLQGWNMEASFNMNDTSYTFDIVADCKIEGTVVLDWVPGFSSAVAAGSNRDILSVATTTFLFYSQISQGYLLSWDGTSVPLGFAYTQGVAQRLILRHSSATRTLNLSKIESGSLSVGANTSFDGSMNPQSDLVLCRSLGLNTKFGNLRFFKRWLSDAELQRL